MNIWQNKHKFSNKAKMVQALCQLTFCNKVYFYLVLVGGVAHLQLVRIKDLLFLDNIE